MENSNKVERSETWVKIWNVVKKLPLEKTNGDAPDAFSVTTEIEQLFLKLHTHTQCCKPKGTVKYRKNRT